MFGNIKGMDTNKSNIIQRGHKYVQILNTEYTCSNYLMILDIRIFSSAFYTHMYLVTKYNGAMQYFYNSLLKLCFYVVKIHLAIHKIFICCI